MIKNYKTVITPHQILLSEGIFIKIKKRYVSNLYELFIRGNTIQLAKPHRHMKLGLYQHDANQCEEHCINSSTLRANHISINIKILRTIIAQIVQTVCPTLIKHQVSPAKCILRLISYQYVYYCCIHVPSNSYSWYNL